MGKTRKKCQLSDIFMTFYRLEITHVESGVQRGSDTTTLGRMCVFEFLTSAKKPIPVE